MPSLASIAGDVDIPIGTRTALAGIAAPAANGVVLTASPRPAAGLYRAHVWAKTSGTQEVIDHNMEVRAGAVVLAQAVQSTPQRGGYRSIGRPFALDGSTDVTVNATAAATGG